MPGFAWLPCCIAVFIVLKIVIAALPAVRQYGLDFLTGRVWDPHKKVYSILPEIWGTLYSSVLALILGTAFGVAAAVFLAEGFVADSVFVLLKIFKLQFHPFWGKLPKQMDNLLRNLIELLAAIPSVVYGLWGLFVVIPLVPPGMPLAARQNGLGAPFWHGPERTGNAAGRDRALDHDTADDHSDRPRRPGRGAVQAEDGRLRVGCDAVGNDSRRDHSHCVTRYFRWRGARLRPRAG